MNPSHTEDKQPLLARVKILPRTWQTDPRGGLLKVLTKSDAPATFGEIYVVTAAPGQERGGHYHPRTAEWFTLLRGKAALVLADPDTGEKVTLGLSAEEPRTVYVPAGIAHIFRNAPNSGEFVILAYADRGYDPSDTILFKF